MKKTFLIALLLLLGVGFASLPAALAGEAEDSAKAEASVKNFEERLEGLSKELSSVRYELENLTKEMLEGETGAVRVYLKGKTSDFADKGVFLEVDGKMLLSRPFTAAELNVLGSDLPLELSELRLGAGEHKALFYPMGSVVPQSSKINVERAKLNTWIVTFEGGAAQWSAE